MNGLFDFLTGSLSKVVDSIGGFIDNITTTDEEKLKLKNELAKVINSYKLEVLKQQNLYEKELTERLKADMTSDSWLSKNVRPLALIFMTISTVILIYLTVFVLDNEMNIMLKEWIDLLKVLLLTIYGFYFGSRSLEKISKIKRDSK